MTRLIANAPVSYGAFELTVGVMDGVPGSERILDEVSSAGYDGIDLGPEGYLEGDGDLATRLSERGLLLAGGYLALPFTQPGPSFEDLERLLSVFSRVTKPSVDPVVKPKPTLADAGSPERLGRIGQAAKDPEVGLDDAGWSLFSDNLAIAVRLCREAGFEPTFHHHAGSHIEAPWEIDRLLEVSDVGLCLDTGHLVVGGGDPITALERFGDRVNHVQIKDVRRRAIEEIVDESAPVTEIWKRRAFCRLGDGDLDIPRLLALLDDYAGWIVVEQDRLPESAADVEEMVIDQRYNRQYLAQAGW